MFTPDGRSIIFVSQRSGVADLWRVSSSGGNPELVFGATGENSDADISADGRKLSFSNTRTRFFMLATAMSTLAEVKPSALFSDLSEFQLPLDWREHAAPTT